LGSAGQERHPDLRSKNLHTWLAYISIISSTWGREAHPHNHVRTYLLALVRSPDALRAHPRIHLIPARVSPHRAGGMADGRLMGKHIVDAYCICMCVCVDPHAKMYVMAELRSCFAADSGRLCGAKACWWHALR
jgi:hypothetical protein